MRARHPAGVKVSLNHCSTLSCTVVNRTNLQWLAHCALLGLSGLAVFKAISLYKNRQPVDQ